METIGQIFLKIKFSMNDTMSYIVGAYCRVQYRPKNAEFLSFLGN